MRSYQELADRWVRGSGGSLDDVDPADQDHVLAKVRLSTKEDARAAVEAALSKSFEWGTTPPPKRGAILLKAGELMESVSEELSELLTHEEGKTLPESRAEVARSCSLFKFYGAMAYKFGGLTLPSSDPNTRVFTARIPLGVVAAITPWNFPVAIPLWKLAPALAYGNAVLLKPAPAATATAMRLGELVGAHLPAGLLAVLPGGAATGQAVLGAVDA
ncbi:MAG: aldehyde dehydrogenase family protein, partial [Nitrososphaerota archaeon]|nr:aldehyde dehydrogenase family protein [Nitrososphaerota archaeon]